VVAGFARYFGSLPRDRDYRKQSYPGARYRHAGKRRACILSETYPQAIGILLTYAIRFADDSREWYIGCYWQGETCPVDQEHYHPFGHSFILFPWVHSEPIDYGERKPYRRMSATIGD